MLEVMKPRLFVLEGPDALGKTTLAKEIAKQLRGVYWHLTATKPLIAAMHDYEVNAIENVEDNLALGYNVVMDRFLDSELVYATALRGKTFKNAVDADLMKRFLALEPTVIFMLDKTVEDAIAKHALNVDEAHAYSNDSYSTVYLRYVERMNNYPIPCFSVVSDFQTKPETQAEKIISQVFAYHRNRNHAQETTS